MPHQLQTTSRLLLLLTGWADTESMQWPVANGSLVFNFAMYWRSLWYEIKRVSDYTSEKVQKTKLP